MLLVMELVELVVWRRPEAKLIYTGKGLEGTGRKKVEREESGAAGSGSGGNDGQRRRLGATALPRELWTAAAMSKGVFRGAQVCVV